MKKSLILGAAAMAAVAAAPQAQAADVKVGGYYQLRMMDSDATINEAAVSSSSADDWVQRAQVNFTAKISEKTSVHLQTRILDSSTMSATADGGGITSASNDALTVKRAWLETEMYGVGIKAGSIPVNLHDKILLKDDGGSMSAILLSKSFGDMTAVVANVRDLDESGGNQDEIEVYLASLLGKAGNINYQLSVLHMDVGDLITTLPTSGANDWVAGSNNTWLAATVGTEMSGMKLSGTAIYELGLSKTGANSTTQVEDAGFLGALRVSGKAGFGGWNGYGFYAGEDYTPADVTGTNSSPGWSRVWDQGGAGGTDLGQVWAQNGGAVALTTDNQSQLANVWGIGAGLTVKAGAWTINPTVDYMAIVEDTVSGGTQVYSDSAWGGSIAATTMLDEGTSFSLVGIGLRPDETAAGTAANVVTDMHVLMAEFKVKF